jgi:hypothetical protein
MFRFALALLASCAVGDIVLLRPNSSLSIPTSNLFLTPTAFDTSTFPALILPLHMDVESECRPSRNSIDRILYWLSSHTRPIEWTVYNRTLFALEWNTEAQNAYCTSQQQLVQAIDAIVVPELSQAQVPLHGWMVLLYGTKDHYFDVASPYGAVIEQGDGVATTPDGARTLQQALSESSVPFLYAQVTREPGEWNVTWQSTTHYAIRWTLVALNTLLLVFGVYRLSKTLLTRRNTIVHSVTTGRTTARLARESHLLLTVNGIAFLIGAILILVLRSHYMTYMYLLYIVWILTFWTISGFHITWSNVAWRVYRLVYYKWLIRMATFNTALATIAVLCMAISFHIASATSNVYKVASQVFYICVPTLFMLQGLFFVLLAIRFLARIILEPISPAALHRLRHTTFIGIAILAAYLLISVATVLFLISLSTQAYYIQLVLTNTAGMVIQLSAFSLGGRIQDEELQEHPDYAWTETEIPRTQVASDGFSADVPLIALDSMVKSNADVSDTTTVIDSPLQRP